MLRLIYEYIPIFLYLVDEHSDPLEFTVFSAESILSERFKTQTSISVTINQMSLTMNSALTFPSLWSLTIRACLILCCSFLSSAEGEGWCCCCWTGLCSLLSCCSSSSRSSYGHVCPCVSSRLHFSTQISSVITSLSTAVRSCLRGVLDGSSP